MLPQKKKRITQKLKTMAGLSHMLNVWWYIWTNHACKNVERSYCERQVFFFYISPHSKCWPHVRPCVSRLLLWQHQASVFGWDRSSARAVTSSSQNAWLPSQISAVQARTLRMSFQTCPKMSTWTRNGDWTESRGENRSVSTAAVRLLAEPAVRPGSVRENRSWIPNNKLR